MRRIFTLIIAVGLMAALLALPTTASAKAEFTEYTGTESAAIPSPIDPFTWVSGPVFHYSHVMIHHDVTDDWRTTGDATVVMNWTTKDWMNGHIRGTFHTEVADPDSHDTGAWDGTWTGKMVDGIPIFKAVGHGSGVLDGLKMKASYVGTPNMTIDIEGRILNPHGN
jgi:hypothetical protein